MSKSTKQFVYYECEQNFSLTLNEITQSFGVTQETIFEIIDQGIISMPISTPEKWVFDHESLRRIRTALRLHQDLGVNFAGAALALELMAEIERLRQQL